MLKKLASTLLLTLCLGLTPALAQEASPPPPHEVLVAAFDGGDADAVTKLAADRGPDPWMIVEQLLRTDRADVAEAYASQVARSSRESLVAYVEARRATPLSDAQRALLEQVKAATPEERLALDLSALDDAAPSVSVATLHSTMAHAYWGQKQFDDASAAYRRRIEMAASIGWVEGGTRAHNSRASLEWNRGRRDAAVAETEASVRLATEAGLLDHAGRSWRLLADMFTRVGRYKDAAVHAHASMEAYRTHGDPTALAHALFHHGNCQRNAGNYKQAIVVLTNARDCFIELGDRDMEAQARNGRASNCFTMGRIPEARREYEAAAAIFKELGKSIGQANVAANLGPIDMRQGRVNDAVARYGFAIPIFEETGNIRNLAIAVTSLGQAHERLGNLAKARELYQRALDLRSVEEDPVGTARRQRLVGELEHSAGRLPEAVAWFTRAVDGFETVQQFNLQVIAMHSLALVEMDLGRFDKARELAVRIHEVSDRINWNLGRVYGATVEVLVENRAGEFERVLEVAEFGLPLAKQRGDKYWYVTMLREAGHANHYLGHHDEAVEMLERCIEAALGPRGGGATRTIGPLLYLADCHLSVGDIESARAAASLALERTTDRTTAARLARIRTKLSLCELRSGNVEEATKLIREALATTASLGAGLPEQDAAFVLSSVRSSSVVATEIALRGGDPEFAAWVFERTAANALRRSIGSQTAIENAVVPAELLEQVNRARQVEARASREMAAARDGGGLKAIRAARARLAEARELRQELATRLQREAASSADLVDPKPLSLAELQASLAPGDALIHYAFEAAIGGALIIRKDGARVVPLGSAETVAALLESTLIEDEPHLSDDALPRLQAFLVDPLELADDVKRVFIVPRGRLAYAPFGALYSGCDVALVPSGTTMALLAANHGTTGEGVLAIGDPVYERGLAPLPGTRTEVEAIGTTKLLGEGATESALLAALTEREHWRSIHFACHGLVDPDRPMLSSLALTPDAEDDGFLSCMDLYGVKTPADLVVLSACQTARGRVYSGEGVLGLTRAFMHGGSPRVICSLWNVDDAATSALMKKFYELWNPSDGKDARATATALREAQAYVRAQPGWEHPRFWAAWVLWGLAD